MYCSQSNNELAEKENLRNVTMYRNANVIKKEVTIQATLIRSSGKYNDKDVTEIKTIPVDLLDYYFQRTFWKLFYNCSHINPLLYHPTVLIYSTFQPTKSYALYLCIPTQVVTQKST